MYGDLQFVAAPIISLLHISITFQKDLVNSYQYTFLLRYIKLKCNFIYLHEHVYIP